MDDRINQQLAQLQPPQWKPGRMRELYVTASGEIVGSVARNWLSEGYSAEAGGRNLGNFYDMASAQRAVEQANG